MSFDYDPAQWWSALGTCRCGKPATGTVMSNRNAALERTCRVCGERRVKQAHRDRQQADKAAMKKP